MAIARFLASTVQARLVRVGRSPAANRQDQVREIERLGGAALYCQADLTRPGEVLAAVTAARTKWGRIDGAIQSALVLADRSTPSHG